MRKTLAHGLSCRGLDMKGRVEIGFADRQAGDVLALGPEVAGALRHAHDGAFIGLSGAAGEE